MGGVAKWFLRFFGFWLFYMGISSVRYGLLSALILFIYCIIRDIVQETSLFNSCKCKKKIFAENDDDEEGEDDEVIEDDDDEDDDEDEGMKLRNRKIIKDIDEDEEMNDEENKAEFLEELMSLKRQVDKLIEKSQKVKMP